MDLGDWGSLAAICGFGWGLWESWRRRIRLKVQVRAAIVPEVGEALAIEVINEGSTPTTVRTIQMVFSDQTYMPAETYGGVLFSPHEIPVRLEGHDAMSVFIPCKSISKEHLQKLRHVLVKTSSGKEFRSDELKEFVELMVFGAVQRP